MGNKPDFSWDDLRIFLELARQGRLSRAAGRLGVDHTTVSRRVAHLELALGAKLFERTRSGMRLRDSGRLLLRHAEAMESQTLAAGMALGAGDGDYVGTVRIAMMEGIGSLYFAPRLAKLLSSRPSIRLELVTSAQPLNLSRREADLFLSFFRPRGRGLRSRKLGEFGLGLFASPAYLKQHGEPGGVADLSRHAFVDYIDDLVAIDAVRWLADVIKAPRIAFHSNSMIAQHHAATAGIGIVLLPFFAAHGDRRLRPVLGKKVVVTRELWLSVHHDLHDAPRVRIVADFLADQINRDRKLLKGAGA